MSTGKAALNITYSGTMNNSMAGFYRSKYKPAVPPAASVPMDGEHHGKYIRDDNCFVYGKFCIVKHVAGSMDSSRVKFAPSHLSHDLICD